MKSFGFFKIKIELRKTCSLTVLLSFLSPQSNICVLTISISPMLNTLLKELFRATGQQRIITPAWHLILPVIFRVPCLLFSRLYYSFGLSIMSTVRYHHMSKTLQYVKDNNNGKFSSYSEIMNKMNIFWQIFMKVN